MTERVDPASVVTAVEAPQDGHSPARTRAEPVPRLLVEQANPHHTVANLRDILAAAEGLFERGTPTRLYRDPAQGRIRAQRLNANDLILHAHSVCRPYKVKTMGGETSDFDVPLPHGIAEMYLGWNGERRLPPLNGIASSPLLRGDGSLHAIDGYDPGTGLWCEQVPDICQLVPDRPSDEDATDAINLLRRTFRTFCFADAETLFDSESGIEIVDTSAPPGKDESAFLAALLTGICRASLPLAPGTLIRAAAMSGAGAGKGLLARCISLIAFGREPHAVSGGSGREELEKRIAAELVEAGPMLFLDNLNNRTFKSDLLASVMTERPASVRILGRTEMVPLNSSALVVLTGNGLMLSEDLARRFLVIELDPRTEDPEARPFGSDIKSICTAARAELLAAALTIWRWGRLAEDLSPGLPSGSFELWSAWVRDPLLKLGCQDPMARVAETKSRDSERAEISEIFRMWWACHQDAPLPAKQLAPKLVEAIDPLNRGRQWVVARLEKLTNTRIAGFVLHRQAAAGRSGVAVYALRRTDAG